MYKPNLAVCVSKKMEKNEEDTRIKKKRSHVEEFKLVEYNENPW